MQCAHVMMQRSVNCQTKWQYYRQCPINRPQQEVIPSNHEEKENKMDDEDSSSESEWDDNESDCEVKENHVSVNTHHSKEADDFTLSRLVNGISGSDFHQKYVIDTAKIGHGASSDIIKVTRKSDKAVFALKKVSKKEKSTDDIAAYQKEIFFLQKCNHQNVIKLIDWCDTDKCTYVILELCDGGDLINRVLECKKLSEKSAIHVIKQVAAGLLHIHELGFIHRDLKLDNIMYLDKSDDSVIKIIDFGLAANMNEGPCNASLGTIQYAAPEVWSGKEYNQSADMWSLGVVLYGLLCGFAPFYDASDNSEKAKIKNIHYLIKNAKYSFPSPYWDEISESAKDLIRKLLVKDPKDRLNAKQVLEHEWIANKRTETSPCPTAPSSFYEDYMEETMCLPAAQRVLFTGAKTPNLK